MNSDGKKVINVGDIKAAIGLATPWFDDLLLRISENDVGDLDFDSFVDFLESGELPSVVTVAEPKKPPVPRSPMEKENKKPAQSPRVHKGEAAFSVDEVVVKPPPGPPLMGFSALQPSGSRVTSIDQRAYEQSSAIARRSVKGMTSLQLHA